MAPVAAAALPDVIKAELQRIRNECVDPIAGFRAQLQSLEQHVAGAEIRGGGADRGPEVGATAASQFQEDPAFAAAAETAGRGMKPSQFSARVNVDSSIKAALTNDGAGQVDDTAIPGVTVHRGVMGPVLRPLRLLSALPSRPTSGTSVEFVQLNAIGDAEEQIKEGDEKAEIEFSGVLKTANIVTIAAHTTASKQVLSDRAALGQQIDRVIRHKVLSRLEDQLINGPGGDGRINGLMNQATDFAPAIGETPADRIGEALVTMANEGYLPDLVLMNPMDWFRIQLTRKNETDDEYVFGSPTMPVPPSLWNSRIVTNPSLTAGNSLVIDTSFTTVLDREQMSVSATNTHADYFTRNLVKILGELRAGLEVLDVKAVRKFALQPLPDSQQVGTGGGGSALPPLSFQRHARGHTAELNGRGGSKVQEGRRLETSPPPTRGFFLLHENSYEAPFPRNNPTLQWFERHFNSPLARTVIELLRRNPILTRRPYGNRTS